ncbi:hypothetical protein V5N11_025757 [Cardamine amara subsp. amara]|uniref:Uncharacterized protein n=1 Tax=Cardamine amara subsp. amara TaxID=228776 RepID=A0ABD0ZX27_CARAN
MPLKEAIKLFDPSNIFLRERVLKRIKDMEELAEKKHEYKTITKEKIIIQEKLEDPGSFTLPCSLNQTFFRNSLCNLGASVSIMPLSVAERLGYEDYKPSKSSLVLGDRIIRRPNDMLENMPLWIMHIEVPTDFIVMKMDEKP